MSVPYWKKYQPDDTSTVHEPALPVDEQHGLPVGVYWTPQDDDTAVAVDEGAPLPTQVVGPVELRSRSIRVGPIEIQGITAADALDANDAMGASFVLVVPPHGTIREAFFHDLDDEGINKELWCFNAPFTAAASDAAFSCSDADNLNVVAVFLFTTWRDGDVSQIGVTANTPVDYEAPLGRLYCQVKTLGTDNIAAGSMPRVSLVVEPRY